MLDTAWNDLEVAPKSAVMGAAKQFAEVFADTSQFHEFEQAYLAFRQDTEAQSAIQEFQKKQASLKALLMLNAVSDEDRDELQRLQDRFYRQPSVLRYAKAQEEINGYIPRNRRSVIESDRPGLRRLVSIGRLLWLMVQKRNLR